MMRSSVVWGFVGLVLLMFLGVVQQTTVPAIPRHSLLALPFFTNQLEQDALLDDGDDGGGDDNDDDDDYEKNEENDWSSTPSAPLTLLAFQPNSVEFSTKWKPMTFKFDNETRRKLWEAVGSLEMDPNNCTSPGRLSIAFRFQIAGFGSRMIRLVSYMLAMGEQKAYRLFLIPLLEYNHQVAPHHRVNTMQGEFEQVFSFASPSTTCNVFASKCLQSRDRQCYSNGYVQPNGKSHYSLVSDWNPVRPKLVSVQRRLHKKNRHEYAALRTQLTRESMRLRAEYKPKIDQQVQKHYANISLNEVFTVAMHIRRTDKLFEEAERVHSKVFVAALLVANRTHNLENKPMVLTVMTDDCRVKHEIAHELSSVIHTHQLAFSIRHGLKFRCETTRPDKSHSSREVTASFFTLLVDLTLMVEADVFIGSQSS
ncbi:hypothetical protein BASA81_007925 [Batrachochytrium salamandrivorans]|nr:hypothetical protein BASA81_007925 [Batrachochytrium salamandrivorans]